MKVIGLTGGIGMGKSMSAKILRERGVAVVDTDDLARDVVEPGQPALAEIRAEFGAEVIGVDGRLRREELAKIVFADDAARQRLESILHPRIRELWRAQVQTWRMENRPGAVVVIPLLYETAAEQDFDLVICIACTPKTQKERLIGRGWTTQQLEQRIAAQMPVVQKIARADRVVWTEGDLAAHAWQLDHIMVGL